MKRTSKSFNITYFRPKMRGNAENKHNNPVNIKFVAKTSDIRNLSDNITSDVMLKYQKWQHSGLPQVSRQKSLDSQKNSLDLKKISRFKVFASKFAVFLEMMHLFILLPKNVYITCKFVKIDRVEVWEISY